MEAFDLQKRAREIMQARGVIEMDALSDAHGALDAAGADVIVIGDVSDGATISNAASVVVRGNVIGDVAKPCQIDADNEVIVLGHVMHASVSTRDVGVGGSLSSCKLNTEGNIEVGEDISDAQIQIGSFDSVKKKVNGLKERMMQTRLDRDATERQLRLEEKRLFKQVESTRISMDFGLGHTIVPKRKRITVDLTRFYEMAKNKSPEAMERALLEFYAKGIVGLLTRANLQFLRSGKNRQAIFKGVISKLKDLILATRKFDVETQLLQDLEFEHDELVRSLQERACGLYVRGQILPSTVLRFVGADVAYFEDGSLQFGMRMAKLDVSDKGIRETDIDGISSDQSPDMLTHVKLALGDEHIEHMGLGATEEGVAL